MAVIGALLCTPMAAVADADGPPAGVSGDAWAGIQDQIEAESHRVVKSDRPGLLWRADNPVQRYSAHFGSEDVVLAPHGRGEPAWEIGLRLVSWGAAHDLQPVDFATATAQDNRVEYRRGPLTEWYVNTTMGLEQGFTIDVPPANDIDELVLEMAIDSGLTAVLAQNGQAITFRHETTMTTLTYSGLAAWDAVGEAKEAWMEVAASGTRLRLVVTVEGAAWPITVDPIFARVARLLPTPDPDTSEANFGQGVSIDGDHMVVGVEDPGLGEEAGAAHVFRRDQGGAGAWGHVAKLTAPDGGPYDSFGRGSVAISGDTVIVGAYRDDDNGKNAGSAYIFRRDQGGADAWGHVAKITAADGAGYEEFGNAVAISNDTAVVGAWKDDGNGSQSGSAYIFRSDHGGPNVWGQVAKITPADGAAADTFGKSVSISGDTAVVGSTGDDDNGVLSGSAYVFRRDHGGPDFWGQVAKITPVDGASADSFGHSVSISGDTAVVSSIGDDENGFLSGSAYVFLRNHGGPEGWGQTAKIAPADAAPDNQFGSSVSISGDTAVVGAVFDNPGSYQGSAYVFERNNGGPGVWGEVCKITTSDGSPPGGFGRFVSISGDIASVGAPLASDNGPYSGSVFVFNRDQGGVDSWGQVAEHGCPLVLAARGDDFGRAAAVDGETAIVGADLDDENGWESGAAYVFERNQNESGNWAKVAKITAADGAALDRFGRSVSISGTTVVVGAPLTSDNGRNSGSAYVFERDQGGPDTWGQTAKIVPADGAAEDYFGTSASISGDTIVIGLTGRNMAYVYQRNQGGSGAWGEIARVSPVDGASGRFGESTSVSSSIAIIGAPYDDDNGSGSGSAYIFDRDQGGPNVWGQIAKITAADGAEGDRFGISVSISGDTAIVGASRDDNNGSDSGSAYIFRRDQGGPDSWDQVARIASSDGSEEDFFGASVSISGSTVLVGAHMDDESGYQSGSAYIFRSNQGGADAWGQVAKIIAADGLNGDEFGISVAISGNTTIIGAPKSDGMGVDSGAAYVYTISDAFFADGFETGDTSAWSVAVP